MIKEITLPDLGEGIDGAEVSEIPVSPGDTVSPDDTILVLESDKASMENPSEVSGTISEILISSGDEVITTPFTVLVDSSVPVIMEAIPVFADIEEDIIKILTNKNS